MRVFLNPMPAAMSPVNTASTSSRLLACIWRMRPMRSLLELVVFTTVPPFSSVPE